MMCWGRNKMATTQQFPNQWKLNGKQETQACNVCQRLFDRREIATHFDNRLIVGGKPGVPGDQIQIKVCVLVMGSDRRINLVWWWARLKNQANATQKGPDPGTFLWSNSLDHSAPMLHLW